MCDDSKAKCYECGMPSPFEGSACFDCLQKAMDSMTPDDWDRELTAVFNHVLQKPDAEKEDGKENQGPRKDSGLP
jgi:hypothetical protein